MLNFSKTVSCLVIRTAPQIDTELMHPFEKFRQNFLVKLSLRFVVVQNIESLKPCHVLLKQPIKMSLFSYKKIVGLRYMTC